VLSTCTATILLAAYLVASVNAHGIFTQPLSRARLSELSDWEKDATTIISEPMPDVGPAGRTYPGNRPFAEPGVRCAARLQFD